MYCNAATWLKGWVINSAQSLTPRHCPFAKPFHGSCLVVCFDATIFLDVCDFTHTHEREVLGVVIGPMIGHCHNTSSGSGSWRNKRKNRMGGCVQSVTHVTHGRKVRSRFEQVRGRTERRGLE